MTICFFFEFSDATPSQTARFPETQMKATHDLLDATSHAKGSTHAVQPDHAVALTNIVCALIQGYTHNYFQDIDTTTSLLREALALRPQRHPDHPSSLKSHQCAGLTHNKKDHFRHPRSRPTLS
ncbi:hypothetical protein CY34DRAFT_720314 [Suillus luteus UH-Slu-Lm8-n1]|uniref:Uncharacterized protein n=1 Tax=Suillus luteus UH-Slu-Lm8-n1 TaxID=930992 RepID=A0A0C9ZV27_9AGAM|nr:hypothetical protein CY34DRAFT_720314 [Suillus luteus UH-Slu-Lm8-n1]